MDPKSLREDGNRPLGRSIGLRERLRRLAALNGLAFFLAVAVVPHSHLNSPEDLLSDGPSDSGIFIKPSSPAAQEPGPSFRAARLVDDDPCLACFFDDFLSDTEPVSVYLFAPALEPLAQVAASGPIAEPAARLSPDQSRSPPTA
jgi:hypothetical protein